MMTQLRRTPPRRVACASPLLPNYLLLRLDVLPLAAFRFATLRLAVFPLAVFRLVTLRFEVLPLAVLRLDVLPLAALRLRARFLAMKPSRLRWEVRYSSSAPHGPLGDQSNVTTLVTRIGCRLDIC